MAKIAVIPAQPTHVQRVAAAMRDADRREVWASSRATPMEALTRSLMGSCRAWTGFVDCEPVCLFGVGPIDLLSGEGAVWLLGADAMERNGMAFACRNRAMLPELFGDLFQVLTNRVDARNLVSLRWLRWLGATITPAEPFGPFRLPFHQFELRREHV